MGSEWTIQIWLRNENNASTVFAAACHLQAADLIDSQAAEIERLKAYNHHCGELDDEIVAQADEIERLREQKVEVHADRVFWQAQADKSDTELTRLREVMQMVERHLPADPMQFAADSHPKCDRKMCVEAMHISDMVRVIEAAQSPAQETEADG